MLLTKFEAEQVLRFSYGNKDLAIEKMLVTFGRNWPHRNELDVCRARAKSAIQVIRELRLSRQTRTSLLIDGYELSGECQNHGDYTFRDVIRYPNGVHGIKGFQIFKEGQLVGQAWDLSGSSSLSLVVLSQQIGRFEDSQQAIDNALEALFRNEFLNRGNYA
ncbi:hypothetical protein [Photobacterium lutimaris]|uniref:Uncharacterized protein n=1 Tax=Photobacterium lutimaris TaxID=388278 RepID=A0A2T3ITR4_9GAMM|nr:hypothetical protein [Photobacterium lutimaris]PSU31756.1 hypothetical protein C9I99_21470 [Photobacterium lutimaris]TDR72594.1 hypothetical protein DFP78_11370 [Photobacterium lutimaris]